jgi:hypothetical protein
LREEQAAGRVAADLDLETLADILMALPFGLEVIALLGGKELDWPAIMRTLSRVLWPGMTTSPVTASPTGAVAAEMPSGGDGSG